MIYGDNLSPIPFYASLEDQDSKKWWAYGDIYSLIVSKTKLIPFFFRFANPNGATIDTIKVYKMCCRPQEQGGDFNYDFNNDFLLERNGDHTYWYDAFNNKINISTANGYTDVYYNGDASALPFEKGRYYMEFIFKYTQSSVEHFISIYSDVFTCVDDIELSNFVKVEWKCVSTLTTEDAPIPYSNGYTNILYLDTDVSQPSYEFEEEGDQRDGYFFPIKQISYKKFTFGITAPEYLCDCMRLIGLSDTIIITDKKGHTYNATQFTLEPTWLEGGHYASVPCEFTTHTVVKTLGKSISV